MYQAIEIERSNMILLEQFGAKINNVVYLKVIVKAADLMSNVLDIKIFIINNVHRCMA